VKLRNIAFIGIGIALYIVMSLTLKIPLIGHISVDLGYIALAVYCYHFGAVAGALVGGAGCALMSTLVYGMFPPGWLVGNLLIGFICGLLYKKKGKYKILFNILLTIIAIFIGIGIIKTVIECMMFHIPFGVKFIKNLVAFICDAIVMTIGILVAPKIPKLKT
jgi:uncharacterized membrane protein